MALPAGVPQTGRGPLQIIRRDWEIFAAAGLMVFVLVVLDLAFLRTPGLILALVPLAFIIIAAILPVGWKTIAAWTAACGALAALLGDWRLASLAYSAIVLGVLHAVHRALKRTSP